MSALQTLADASKLAGFFEIQHSIYVGRVLGSHCYRRNKVPSEVQFGCNRYLYMFDEENCEFYCGKTTRTTALVPAF
jgi:hypothetical protein